MYPVDIAELLRVWEYAGEEIVKAFEGTVAWSKARETYGTRLLDRLPPPPGLDFRTVDLGGVPTLMITPDEIDNGRVLLYFHGGGYVHGDVRAYYSLCGHLAKKLRAKVYVPDYRQAPEYPFPFPIDDAFAAYAALLKSGRSAKEIVFAGDSAGGALVITVMRRAKAAGLALPIAGASISPWVDLLHAGSSARNRAHIPSAGNLDSLNLLARTFLNDALPNHPEASPVHADLRGLTPILIQMGENELMLSGGVKLAERLADQRVRVTLEVWPKMFHVWHLFAGHLPEADEALDNTVSFLNREFLRSE